MHRAPDREPTPAPSCLPSDHPRPPGHPARGQHAKRHWPAGHGSGVSVAVQPDESCPLDTIGWYVNNRAVVGHRHVRVSMVSDRCRAGPEWDHQRARIAGSQARPGARHRPRTRDGPSRCSAPRRCRRREAIVVSFPSHATAPGARFRRRQGLRPKVMATR